MKLSIALILYTISLELYAMSLVEDINLFRCKQPYQIPAEKELLEAKSVFSQLLNNKNTIAKNTINSTAMTEQLEKTGFKSRTIEDKNVHWLLLQEQKNKCQGRGHILLNQIQPENTRKPVFLQAPHIFHDKRTAKVVKKLFATNHYQLAFFNNSHRYQMRQNKFAVSDLTRNNNNYLAILSEVFSSLYPDSMIVQIHGFSLKKRKSARGKSANIILSQGHFYPNKILYRLKNCFSRQFADKNTYLYPDEIRELGATQNTLGRTLVQNNYHNFIHIELDADFRKELTQTPQQLEKFSACLLENF